MKQQILSALESFEADLRGLRKDIRALTTERVGRADLRQRAEVLADTWVEELRSPLEHKFALPTDVIQEMSALMKRLHVLSRPNNRCSSYDEVLTSALAGFKNRFALPIQQASFEVESKFDLAKVVSGLTDAEESDYLAEAVACANAGFRRAAVVLGWCAAIDRIQRKIQAIGFAQFNAAAERVRLQTSGKFKTWNKSFNITTAGELQAVFDRDLITVLEGGLELVDSNQADRLRTDFEYRNQSAHPGLAPIDDPHVIAFFSDIASIVLLNPALEP